MSSEEWRDWKHSTWKIPLPNSVATALEREAMEVPLGYLASALRCALMMRDQLEKDGKPIVEATAISLERTVDVMMLGAALFRGHSDVEQVRQEMADLLVRMLATAQSVDHLASAYTYVLLTNRVIDRATAAIIASDIRGKPVTTDAWRVYLDKWVHDTGLPKVGIRKRKSQKRTLTKK